MEVLKSVQAILNKVFRDSEGNSYLSGIMKSATAILNMVYDSEEEALNVCVKTTDGEDLQDYIDGEIDLCEKLANKGAASGYCPLGSDSKVPVANMPYNALNYKGSWNATTNTPTLSSSGGGGSQGDYYIVGVAGTTTIDGVSSWSVGDWIVNNGSTWTKVDNTDLVTSVAGRTGAVTLSVADLAALTTGKALQSNSSTGLIEVSNVTNAELALLSGLTSLLPMNKRLRPETYVLQVANGISYFTVPTRLNGKTLSTCFLAVDTAPTGVAGSSFQLTKNGADAMLSSATILQNTKYISAIVNGANATVATGDILRWDVTATDGVAAGLQSDITFV